jgi:hypothetical protein
VIFACGTEGLLGLVGLLAARLLWVNHRLICGGLHDSADAPAPADQDLRSAEATGSK